jgi:hypothetical protein
VRWPTAADHPGASAGWAVMHLSTGVMILGVGALGVVVWVLHKIGRALAAVLEAMAALAVVFVALWWLVKGFGWCLRQVVARWRTSLVLAGIFAWVQLLGAVSLVSTVAGVVLVFTVWRTVSRVVFDHLFSLTPPFRLKRSRASVRLSDPLGPPRTRSASWLSCPSSSQLQTGQMR